ncbi:MAG: HEAT repeat domain-containing protein, partial [Gemmataceae bacterium]
GTKSDKADSTALPRSRVAEGDPLKNPMEFQKPTKEKAEAGASLMDKLRKNLGLKDSTTSHAAEGSNKERGSNRDRQPGGRSMEAAGISGQFGVGEGFPIMLGGQPANPPSFQDLPKPPYAPNLPGPDSNPYVASPDRGVSPGMSNAFTATSSTRPIPADFGNLPVKQNAFGPPSVPGPAPVAQVNLPLPGRNILPPNPLGMPHQATPLQALPGNAPAVLNLGKKKSKVDDDGVSNAFTDAPQLVGQPTQPTPLAPATLVTTAASSAKVNLDQPIRQLRESLLPSERELAIEAMAETDLRQQNEAASALLTAAFRDPAVTVRLCAIRTLALKLGHNPQILGALRTLKEDGDARIRAEAESALNQTGTSLPTPPSMPRPAAPRAFPIGS